MYFLGIDSGSLSTDAVIMSESKVVSYSIVPTGASNRKAAERSKAEALEKAGLEKIEFTVATGYGRDNVELADASVTEITCHARGASFLFPDVRTVIDIGGQDSKIIRINEQGRTTDFVMNDKCAAGTGRFLEVMARALEVHLDDMGPLSLQSTRDVNVSSTCTVFAESEVVGLVAAGNDVKDILRGLHRAIAGRVVALTGRVGVAPRVVMTGGVAKNIGVKRAIEEKLGMEITAPQEPQIAGALGAALIASEKFREKCAVK
jgi:(R)-2-hydroxyacyl-CoA dehydratese activating ATPase